MSEEKQQQIYSMKHQPNIIVERKKKTKNFKTKQKKRSNSAKYKSLLNKIRKILNSINVRLIKSNLMNYFFC